MSDLDVALAMFGKLLAALEDALGRIESFENNEDPIADALARRCRSAIDMARGGQWPFNTDGDKEGE